MISRRNIHSESKISLAVIENGSGEQHCRLYFPNFLRIEIWNARN